MPAPAPTSGLSRRPLLTTAAVGAAGAVVAGTAARASAATYTAAAYTKTPVSTAADRHLLSRFTYGWTPALRAEVAAAGGIATWWSKQLAMTGIDDTLYSTTATWWPSVNATKDVLAKGNSDGTLPFWVAGHQYQCWNMVRKISSKRQVQEVMAEFWEHHFNVPIDGGPTILWRADYGKGIRSRALGKFTDLLNFTTVHSSMQLYLTNFNSTKVKPNENLARELLELHTVGRGNFTEDDVKNVARVLTGWKIDGWQTWTPTYDPNAHYVGAVKVLGWSHANTSTDGRAAVTSLLTYLASHPATGQRIARRLAKRFVSDSPSQALVDALATSYKNNATSIAAVLKTLAASAEFKASADKKVRTPWEDVIATYRALGVTVAKPTTGQSAANLLPWQADALGLQPFTWPRPDGRPDNAEAYSSASRFLASLTMHYTMSGAWWPTVDTTYKTPASWIPEANMRFDLLVDHMSRVLTGRASTARLLQACCEATSLTPSTVIGSTHPLRGWLMPALLTVFLDQPAHMMR